MSTENSSLTAGNVETSSGTPSTVTQTLNPANAVLSIAEQIASGTRKRVPMNNARRKLEVPEIAGFVTYWFREDRIPEALDAGYEFADTSEISTNQFSPGASQDITGSVDMGTKVSVIGTRVTETGKPGRAYLMKIRIEWYNEDRQMIAGKNAQIIGSVFKGEVVHSPETLAEDRKHISVGSANRTQSVLNRPTRKDSSLRRQGRE